jgi:hypothetical protein
MARIMKRLGVELIWFVGACVVGAIIWVLIASGYEAASDAYWATNGHPPPRGTYQAPWDWRFVIMLAPYPASWALRLAFDRAFPRPMETA